MTAMLTLAGGPWAALLKGAERSEILDISGGWELIARVGSLLNRSGPDASFQEAGAIFIYTYIKTRSTWGPDVRP